ncbi:glutamate--tRNA ligase [Arenicella chitinivorans]|uniref:Glutamate--tRNA ligase n=1 Tax=Arenicella chitinivorans TaxID=1329800 RepID=A0A918VNW7_9GAMM|nr:glutamate--tRNA ligase [Arenicella chitinivorans]GHA12308.1 glutamate--tRNA ligase [Arenicella chitinivorans]
MTVTRFPPSPTGYLHIGGARTAFYSWLHARQNNGRFVLRIEDTDLERSTQESVQAILDGMQWLGLDYDEGPYYQTQRFDRYKEVIADLLAAGHAYHCECSKERLDAMREEQKANGLKPKYDGRCRELGLADADNTVVRFKNPLTGDVVIEDMVKGNIVISNHELDDLVIARPDGVPTYNLTVVVDDMDMGITHVIRGDDHINNTPRQINILRALGAELPRYGHVPMILGQDGARLSKRHGAVSVMQYRDEGYLPEALLNYLVRLGWSHGDQELFTQQELLDLFRIEDVSRAPSAFNPEKLLWVNQEKIKQLSAAELLDKSAWYFKQAGIQVEETAESVAVIDLIKERCKTLLDVVTQSQWYFCAVSEYDAAAVKKWIKPGTSEILSTLIGKLADVSDWTADNIQHCVQQTVDAHEVGFAKVAQPVRIAVTGGTNSPSIDATLAILGSAETLKRLRAGLAAFV